MLNKIKNRLKNKKGASMMEFFVLTIVVLLIGAIIFILGNNMRGGVDTMQNQAGGMAETLQDGIDGFDAFN